MVQAQLSVKSSQPLYCTLWGDTLKIFFIFFFSTQWPLCIALFTTWSFTFSYRSVNSRLYVLCSIKQLADLAVRSEQFLFAWNGCLVSGEANSGGFSSLVSSADECFPTPMFRTVSLVPELPTNTEVFNTGSSTAQPRAARHRTVSANSTTTRQKNEKPASV